VDFKRVAFTILHIKKLKNLPFCLSRIDELNCRLRRRQTRALGMHWFLTVKGKVTLVHQHTKTCGGLELDGGELVASCFGCFNPEEIDGDSNFEVQYVLIRVYCKSL
jgi:hypothetical protein